MLVRAEHVFYLDYELPAFDRTEGLQLNVKYDKYTIHILGWNRSEPLFAGELGYSIGNSEWQIQPADGRGGLIVRRPKETVVDRLTVILEWDVESNPLEDAQSLTNEALEQSVSLANFVIEHMRAVTGVTHLKRIRCYWHPTERNYSVQIPYSVSWFDQDSETPLPLYDGVNSICSAGSITNPFTGSLKFADLEKSLATGVPPRFDLSLLVDAEDALTSLSAREAVLFTASACEVAGNRYIEEQTKLSAEDIERIKGRKVSFAKRSYDLIPAAVCGRTLSTEVPDAYRDIEKCYRERNNIMHQGVGSDAFRDLGLTDRLNEVTRWRTSAVKAVAWIESIPRQ